MPRERCFSEAEVLERLTDVFAAHGYTGTSLALLQQATGLGKQSLYNAFGDKQAMYLQAIDCATRRAAHVAAAMQGASDGRAALQAFFAAMLDDCASPDPGRKSCIVTTGLVEGLDEAPLAWALTSRWQATHELLRASVERGQRDGSVANQAPSADLAELLAALVSGLRVAARAGRSRQQMERLAALTLGVLDRA
ncbi:TetR/AcrR family transcriptional regulator [Rubrivivax benzoatilyticus]|uniref:TetR/AcrR family transcriptional regulator n=1 Tax=Rubrivivax benzoatilyticus TaxID=316997 RepID=A0ABX0HU55_9BURK|nr:TetR/AcrR family transcriptional regulator [Rubrivivax benzoatilyticus]EGJ08734.1 TetR family transcriptional regulator [Rubrivivax benzoatilyticus JA2 = ATCC BAA-35]NHK97151.1 TetR/AcrR family transcriptional regulator [Rubrivivax benzoatilyticus]NHL23154.1 TetR/AcrR family transcriptional regulator [Rubrivivax benzoatilyticus]